MLMNGVDNRQYATIDTITQKCFFDIKIDGINHGRMIIALFGNTVPISVRNFVELCSGKNGKSKISEYELSYTNTKFHRIIPGFIA